MGFLKKLVKGVGDVAQGVAKIAVAPINAVTGHEYNPNMDTKIGKALEWVGDAAEDNIQTLYGIQGEYETKFGAAVGAIGGKIVNYIPIAGQLHQLATPIMKGINSSMTKAVAETGQEPSTDPTVLAQQFIGGVVQPSGMGTTGDPYNDALLYFNQQIDSYLKGQQLSDLNKQIAIGGLQTIDDLERAPSDSLFSSPMFWVLMVAVVAIIIILIV